MGRAYESHFIKTWIKVLTGKENMKDKLVFHYNHFQGLGEEFLNIRNIHDGYIVKLKIDGGGGS